MNIRPHIAALTAKPNCTVLPFDRAAAASALIAGGVACGVPLLQGVLTSWSLPQLVAYIALAAVYLLMVQQASAVYVAPTWIQNHTGWYVVFAGVAGFGLQSLSGDPFIQPIVFTIPLVQATMSYAPLQVIGIGAAYLSSLALGLWTSGAQNGFGLLVSVASYGALMVFMYAFTRLSVEQSLARARADELAAELARERDDLVRLAAITATLTRDLDLDTVVAQVAAAGQQLARAIQARVWLITPEEVDIKDVYGDLTPLMERALAQHSALIQNAALAVPLRANDVIIGVLELHRAPDAPFSADDLRLIQPFVAAAAIAIENAQLFAQAQHAATLAERNRLARELHDTIAQGLTAVAMQLEAAQRSFERDPARTRARLSRAHEITRQTLDDVRGSVWTLAEPLLDGGALLSTLAELAQQFGVRTGVPASYQHSGDTPELSAMAATQVARVVREALHNVEKHAQAHSVAVTSSAGDAVLRVDVCDDGIGFVADPALNAKNGFGLLSLRERARLAGGSLAIESALGVGTRVTLMILYRKQE